MGLIDDIVRDISDITSGTMSGISDIVEQDSQAILLRRFRKTYPKLTVEETIGVRDSLGHTSAEAKPCKTCRIMAVEEFRLGQEQE